MSAKSILLIVFSGIVLLFSSCGKSEVKRAFYYWKGEDLSIFEEHLLDENNISKLYIKLFEVTMDQLEGIIPVSKSYMELPDEILKNTEIVPCVFIENDVMARATEEELDELAENTVFLTNKYLEDKLKVSKASTVTCKEIQIDCDWMASSKENYFYFLKALKKHTDKQISCTLRLYPYKFTDEMGTPPVDRAMLLCYNLLNPKTNADKNSILDLGELEKYLVGAKPYPLPLDIGLPVYSSCYKFVNGQFDEVEHHLPEDLENICLPSEDGLWYTVKMDTSLYFYYYRQGQRIKIERITPKVLYAASELVIEHVPLDDEATVALYHLDQLELNKYKHATLDSVYMLFDQR